MYHIIKAKMKKKVINMIIYKSNKNNKNKNYYGPVANVLVTLILDFLKFLLCT